MSNTKTRTRGTQRSIKETLQREADLISWFDKAALEAVERMDSDQIEKLLEEALSQMGGGHV